MPSFRLGDALGEFADVASADQLALEGVTAWRHGPVISGGVTAPDPPLRVPAPEPLELGILSSPLGPAVMADPPYPTGGPARRPGGRRAGPPPRARAPPALPWPRAVPAGGAGRRALR